MHRGAPPLQVVWPSIPCLKMPWTFKENKTSTTLPFRFFHHRFMLYGSDPERDPAGAKCAYVFLAHGTCFLHGIHALAEVGYPKILNLILGPF